MKIEIIIMALYSVTVTKGQLVIVSLSFCSYVAICHGQL